MTAKWELMTLKQAGISLIDCVHKTPEAVSDGFPYVTIPEMKNGRIDFEAARRISASDFEEWTKKARPRRHDVILSRRTNPGVIAVDDTETEFALGQNLVLLRSDSTKVYPPFLRWLARGPEWWEQIEKYINVGAVFSSLRCGDVPKFELTIPPLPEQQAIAAALGALDDKIELNRRMNRTLEAMARALFRSWFVDFDAVRAKAEGRAPAHMDPATAALFPARFGEDGLPEGWRAGKVEDLLTLQRGFDLPVNNRAPGSYSVIAAGGHHGTHNEFRVNGPGVTTGRSGILGNVYFVHDNFWPLNTSLWVKEYPRSSPYFAYFLLQTLDLSAINSGSAVPSLNRNYVHALPAEVPPADTIAAFDQFVGPLFHLQRVSDENAATLADLRDTLLPRLMSGELRLRDAERALAEAV